MLHLKPIVEAVEPVDLASDTVNQLIAEGYYSLRNRGFSHEQILSHAFIEIDDGSRADEPDSPPDIGAVYDELVWLQGEIRELRVMVEHIYRSVAEK